MAILFRGISICPICNDVIKENDAVYMFPPFIPNTLDPIYFFNDGAFHKDCLGRHSLGEKATEFSERYLFKTRPENRICDIGGNLINNPDDYLFIHLLTSKVDEELYKFNLMTLDKNNLKKWNKRQDFITTATHFKNSGKWGDLTDFKYLDYLIKAVIQKTV